MRKIIALFILLMWTSLTLGQKTAIDTNAVKNWKYLQSPMVSSDGKFVAYTLRTSYQDSTTVVVKSLINNWTRTFTYPRNHFFASFTSSYFAFIDNTDTLFLVSLGKNILEKYPHSLYMKESENGKILGIMTSEESLFLRSKTGSYCYSNVLDFSFTQHPTEVIIIRRDLDRRNSMEIVNLNLQNGKEIPLWGASSISNMVYNRDKTLIAFESFDSTEQKREILVYDLIHYNILQRIDVSKTKLNEICGFNRNSEILFLRMTPNYSTKSESNLYDESDVTVWRATDPVIPPHQDNNAREQELLFSLLVSDGKLIQVSQQKDQIMILPQIQNWNKEIVVAQTSGDCYVEEQLWNPNCFRKWFRVNLFTGAREQMTKFDGNSVVNKYEYSPDMRYIIYFDETLGSYFSYSVERDSLIELTGELEKTALEYEPGYVEGYLKKPQRGIAGFNTTLNKVYIYDANDIWRFDLNGKSKPVNVTGGYGKRNNIAFSCFENKEHDIVPSNGKLTFIGLNLRTKDNGFFEVNVDDPSKLKVLSYGRYIFYLPHYIEGENRGMLPIKAKKKDVFIIRRESCTESPNYFVTTDFLNLTSITDCHPEQKYRWFRNELHQWKNKDGRLLQGILYKPDDYDSTKRHPLIFNIYQSMSNSLNAFLQPDYIAGSCNINIPLLMAKGYLVFKPDIYYKLDSAGESALSCVKSAVNYLGSVPGIDTTNLGIQGCSWGGFETNYIISHSNIFKAACSAAGASDIMGFASIKYNTIYTSFFYGQFRMKSMVWNDYMPFVANSPIFKAGNINTPLLLFHTKYDDAVPFSQGAQLFLVLRKLRKPVWLLEYGGGANHGLYKMAQKRDFSIRISDFFDHFLLGHQIAKWM